MVEIKWNPSKSERLKKTRGVSFDEIIKSKLVDVMKHPKNESQSMMLFEYKKYIWVLPFVQSEKGVFLKTLYPSRKYTKTYKKEEK